MRFSLMTGYIVPPHPPFSHGKKVWPYNLASPGTTGTCNIGSPFPGKSHYIVILPLNIGTC